jgi:hypothetical protein
MNKIAIFGAGEAGKSVFNTTGPEHVLCFVDNHKAGQQYCGLDVIGFEELLEIRGTADVVVASYNHAEDICVQLEEGGIKDYFVWTRGMSANSLRHAPCCMRDMLIFGQTEQLLEEVRGLRKAVSMIKANSARNYREYENRQRLEDPVHLDRFGYKVYSQNDEDGVIEEIFNRIGATNRTFVEFGVQNGLESNCHFLLFKGWNGLWIEGDKGSYTSLQRCFEKPLASKQLVALNAFITVENINNLIESSGVSGEIDLLSIDIDGNDYWIWESIVCIRPRVVVIEYNAKFPPPCEWIMEYDPKYVWDGSDKQGASLKSLELLGRRLGYNLVGTSTNGINAFFVSEDLTKNLFPGPATAENLYHAWTDGYAAGGHIAKRYIGG